MDRRGDRDSRAFQTSPAIQDEGLKDEQFPTLTKLREKCPRDEPAQCRDHFESMAGTPAFTEAEKKYLARYQELQTRRIWRETIPLDLRMPLARSPEEQALVYDDPSIAVVKRHVYFY